MPRFIRRASAREALFYSEALIKSTLMTPLSTVRKLTILARVASQYAGRSHLATAAMQAGRVTLVHVTRVMHILWLEVMGFVFLGIAAIAGYACFHEYTQFQAGAVGSGRAILAAAVALMFAWFGVSSFWRARRKS